MNRLRDSLIAAVLLLACGQAAAIIVAPGSQVQSGTVYTNRLFTVLDGSSTTNRLWWTNASSVFGNTNAIHIKSNATAGAWQWLTNATGIAATNDSNRATGTWHAISDGAAYGVTLYEPIPLVTGDPSTPASGAPNPDFALRNGSNLWTGANVFNVPPIGDGSGWSNINGGNYTLPATVPTNGTWMTLSPNGYSFPTIWWGGQWHMEENGTTLELTDESSGAIWRFEGTDGSFIVNSRKVAVQGTNQLPDEVDFMLRGEGTDAKLHVPWSSAGPVSSTGGFTASAGAFTGLGSGLTGIPISGLSITGTPDGSKFLRDDGSWQGIPGGGDMLAVNNLSDVANTGTARTNLAAHSAANLTIGTLANARLDTDLQIFAGITPSANVQSLLGAADYSAMRTLLALVPGTHVQAFDADLSTYAGITPSANVQSLLGAADYSAMRTALSLVIGVNVQAYDADLTTWAGLTPSANWQTYIGTPSLANWDTLLGITGTASSSTYLRGDGSWQTVSGAGDFLADGSVPMTGDLNLGGNDILNAGTINTTNLNVENFNPTNIVGLPCEFIVALTNQVNAVATGTGYATFRAPYAFTLTAVRASLKTAQSSGSIFTVDINEGGASVLSTALTIDNSESTSTTAATAAVISDTAIADDAVISFDIDQVGTGGVGPVVVLKGTRNYTAP